jgi:hypothetical protein
MARLDDARSRSLLAAVNEDPEFQLAARFWSGSFRLGMGPAEAYVFRIRDGRLVDVNLAPTSFDAWDFEIAGPAEGWTEILAPVPKPFYQDVASALLRHGFTLGGDVESYFAYHAALRRLVDLMRQT